MSFRDEVKDTTRAVMIETFITSLFSDPNRRFGDILEDLIDTDDPDDDWMRDTLYDLEIGQIVRAGAKVMGLIEGDLPDPRQMTLGEADADDADDAEPAPPPKKKKKKKKKKPPEHPSPKKKKKKNRDKGEAAPARRRPSDDDSGKNSNVAAVWAAYKKSIVHALRACKAYDEDTAVNNGVILNAIHGENSWDKAESAQLRTAMEELGEADKIDKVGQRRGTRYHLK